MGDPLLDRILNTNPAPPVYTGTAYAAPANSAASQAAQQVNPGVGDLADIMPAQQPQTPLPSPSLPPNPVEQSKQAVQQPGGLKSMLKGMLWGMSRGGFAAAGIEAPEQTELKRQQLAIAQQNATSLENERQDSAAFRNKQLQIQQQMVTLPNGAMVPYALAQKIYPEFIKGQFNLAGKQLQFGPGLPVDPELAQLAGKPELAGQPLPKNQFDQLVKTINARGFQIKDLGADGQWLVDRTGTKLKQISTHSPAIDRMNALVYGRAATTPFSTVDNQGNPTTISNLQAIQQGAVGIGKPNLGTTLGKAALLGDIKGGIDQVRQYTDVFDDATSRKKIAAVLAQPGLTAQTFFQSPIAGSMNERTQQAVIQLLNLKENAMAMRSVLGAGQGSEDLRRAIQQTIPGAVTPSKKYADSQLDTFANTLSRLERGIPNLGAATQRATGSAQTPPASAPKAAPKSSFWGGIDGAVPRQ